LINHIFRISGIESKRSELKRILIFFRYISFVVTSLFFMLGGTPRNLLRRLFIVACIGVSAIIVTYLYDHLWDKTRLIAHILLIETIFNSIIIIPSGGPIWSYVADIG